MHPLLRGALVTLTLLSVLSCDRDPDADSYEGSRSYYTLTTSNGLTAATYLLRNGSEQGNKLNRFVDHIYSKYDETTAQKNYLYDMYFGYRKNGISSASTWLNGVDPKSAAYIPGTGVIKTVQEQDGLQFESWYFTPFHAPGGGENTLRALVAVVKVKNTGTAAQDCSLFSLMNFHMEGIGNNTSESIVWNGTDRYLMESKGTRKFIYKNLISSNSAYSADTGGAANNPWMLASGGSHFNDYGSGLTGNDIAAGFENRINNGGTFAAGDSAWFGVVVGYSADQDEATLWNDIKSFINNRTPEQIVNGEIDWWTAWHQVETAPSGLTSRELDIYRQSTAILKMGQVRESGGGEGQILASLIPGMWNISWVRDASYAIMGLSAAGHMTEARQGLAFMLNAQMRMDGARNYYEKNYIAPDLGVTLNTNYVISVTRYFGNGLEESDSNAAGPNIEWDNWGLFLWALGDYTAKSGDTSLATAHWSRITAGIADLLIQLIDPAKNILREDSSIWERHWAQYGSGSEPETRKHFAYSSICAYKGLKMTAALAQQLGDTTRQAQYDAQADLLKSGILTNFVITPATIGEPVLAGNIEEMGPVVKYMDLAVVEAFNTGILDGSSSITSGTIKAFDMYLKTGSHSPGYFRNDDGTWYDQQEWVVIDLRVASAFSRIGMKSRARTLLDWISSQASCNFNLIGELLTAENGSYTGAIPMCGFGPGAYILALTDYYAGL